MQLANQKKSIKSTFFISQKRKKGVLHQLATLSIDVTFARKCMCWPVRVTFKSLLGFLTCSPRVDELTVADLCHFMQIIMDNFTRSLRTLKTLNNKGTKISIFVCSV